jgi:hypothetical protein
MLAYWNPVVDEAMAGPVSTLADVSFFSSFRNERFVESGYRLAGTIDPWIFGVQECASKATG